MNNGNEKRQTAKAVNERRKVMRRVYVFRHFVIRNITQDTEVDGLGGVNFAAKRNYFWGWFMIDRLNFIIR